MSVGNNFLIIEIFPLVHSLGPGYVTVRGSYDGRFTDGLSGGNGDIKLNGYWIVVSLGAKVGSLIGGFFDGRSGTDTAVVAESAASALSSTSGWWW